MGQSLIANNAATKDAHIILRMEECAVGMGRQATHTREAVTQ